MRRYLLIVLLMLCASFGWAQDIHISIWKGTPLHRHHVEMTAYLPLGTPRAAVIICPGGSYCWHGMKIEGREVAEWLQQNGIAAFVLKYRVQGVFPYILHTRLLFRGRQHPDMLEDVQRAIQLVRERATDYHLESDAPIGTMGFSAGGHLAMCAAEYFHTDFLALHNISHSVSLRPDFAAPIYPVVTFTNPYAHKRSRRALLGEKRKRSLIMRDSLSIEKHVPQDCPPVFLVNCRDDRVVKYHNSEMLDSALTARGISHRYIQYATGGHGFGASETHGTAECRQWKSEFLQWLDNLLKRNK